MRHTSFPLLCLLLTGGMFFGCRSDVQLDKITYDGTVGAKLSLPVGSISTTFADMIGLVSSDAQISINERGILELRLKEHEESEFHAIDLKTYIGTVNSSTNLLDVNPELALIPAGTPVDVPFKLDISFNGVNDNMSNERLDSMAIEQAEFTTNIRCNNLSITDADIKKVVMRLGDQFRCTNKDIELPNFRLGTDVKITLSNFTLVMMKDETQAPGNDNVLNKADVTFIISLQSGENVMVAPNSGFSFTFQVDFMDYSALYGFFEPGDDTRDINTFDLPLKIAGGHPLILPVKEPDIKMLFTYGLSMPLDIQINHIKAIHPDGSETLANWSGTTTPNLHLYNVLPIDAPLDATVTDSSVILSNASDKGQIDKFFRKEVKSLAYDYKMLVDTHREINGKVMNHFRLTKNTKFSLDFLVTMPFDFHEGMNVEYDDVIRDISLSVASLDSLAAKTNGLVQRIDNADLYFYLTITNDIPVDMTLGVHFLDEHEQELKFTIDDIAIAGATVSGSQITSAETTATLGVKTADFEEIAKTRALRIYAKIGDEQKPSTFYADQKLTIRAGVTADVQAVLNLNAQNGNNKNNK